VSSPLAPLADESSSVNMPIDDMDNFVPNSPPSPTPPPSSDGSSPPSSEDDSADESSDLIQQLRNQILQLERDLADSQKELANSQKELAKTKKELIMTKNRRTERCIDELNVTPHSSNTVPPTRSMWQQWQDRANIITGALNSRSTNTPNKFSCVYSHGDGECRWKDRQNSLLCYVRHLLTHHNENIRDNPNFDLLPLRSCSAPVAEPVAFKSRNPAAVVPPHMQLPPPPPGFVSGPDRRRSLRLALRNA